MDAPKSLSDSRALEVRREALTDSHIAPLADFVARLRRSSQSSDRVPDFDPLDGGVHAECLFLLEAPGGRAVGSGFVSRNNPDETAKNFFLLNREAGLSRVATVTWNVVPWYVGSGKKIRAVTQGDINASMPYLEELMGMLSKLRVVVLIGRKAQRVEGYVKSLPGGYAVLKCPHPSPLSLNGRPDRRGEILKCLNEVGALLAEASREAPNPSIERTSCQPLRGRQAAAHVKR